MTNKKVAERAIFFVFMGLATNPKTYADNENLLYTDLNNSFETIYNEFNGNIDNANIKSGAGIVESKISFSGSGHGHTGGADGKLIAVNRGFGFFIPGTPSVANDLSWNPRADKAMTALRTLAYAKTAPVGAALICRVYNITQAAVVGSVTIADGAQTGVSTTFTTASIAQDDVLRVDVTQIGSGTAGADISIVLGCSQP